MEVSMNQFLKDGPLKGFRKLLLPDLTIKNQNKRSYVDTFQN